ncbi:hypothetical protein CHT98_27655 (plasmid) [Azospirillum brasilense]|uniref:Uncharacterized protein n=1 Tax=Azospirillum brasilense TaxID=192 RepID=A0A235H5S2_AZOBR|nr:hypothetical protein CHT98_27655 [Azospirillum brasilense]
MERHGLVGGPRHPIRSDGEAARGQSVTFTGLLGTLVLWTVAGANPMLWRDGQSNPLPSRERVARRAGEGDARVAAFGKSATPSP